MAKAKKPAKTNSKSDSKAKQQKPLKSKKAASSKLKKEPKRYNFNYWAFNIKLFTKRDKTAETYQALVRKLWEDRRSDFIANDKKMMLRTQFSGEVDGPTKSYPVLYGDLVRYSLIEGDRWFNELSRDNESVSLPTGVFPSAFNTRYMFFPLLHRMYVKVDPKITPTAVSMFLFKALNKIIEQDESITVSIVQSQDVIDSILNSRKIKSLLVDVSYTNDDLGDMAKEAIDGLLKAGNAGSTKALFRAEKSQSLDKDSTLIRGFVELAKDNGVAEASVVNAVGKRERIVTNDHPEKMRERAENEQQARQQLFLKELKRLRGESNGE